MATKKIGKKIFKIKKRIDSFITNGKWEDEDIHKIRVSTREVLSLLGDKELNCSQLKKVIKLSNKIRDIDVLLSEYLVKIPKKYQSNINLPILKDILRIEREKEFKIFLTYLNFLLSMNIEFEQSNQIKKTITEPRFSSDIKELHKYRIYIKNQLYIAKNEKVKDKTKIKLLTKIKNFLGNINDNYNAIEFIKKVISDKINIKGLVNYTNKQNNKYFKKAENLIFTL